MLKVSVLVFYHQALCLNESGDVHRGFQSLLREVSTSGPKCLLRTANRLFGEKTCDFLPVSSARTSIKKDTENKTELWKSRNKV